MVRTPLAFALALMLTGCIVPGSSMEPMFGHLEMTRFDASATYDLLAGIAHVRIVGAVQSERAEDVRVDMYVVDRPCAIGPESREVESWLAHEMQRTGDPDAGMNETRAFGSSFTVGIAPGREYAALAAAQADNTIGPFFAECKTFRAG